MKKLAAVFSIFAALLVPGCQKEYVYDNIDATGWVRNVNMVSNYTEFAFESQGNPTPWSARICKRMPELWQGEYVHIRLSRDFDANNNNCWNVDLFQRLGSDKSR